MISCISTCYKSNRPWIAHLSLQVYYCCLLHPHLEASHTHTYASHLSERSREEGDLAQLWNVQHPQFRAPVQHSR